MKKDRCLWMMGGALLVFAVMMFANAISAQGADPFATYNPSLSSPAEHGAAVTPNDDADLTTTSRSLYIGTGGDVVVILKGDSAAVTFVSVPAGSVLPVRAQRVKATGTTATNIVALW